MQTSELGGAGSIMALAATVASRSKLVPDAIRQAQPHGETKIAMAAAEVPEHVPVEKGHGFYCCRASKELPRHPLVDLDEAVKDLLNGVGHFAHTREEYSGA